MNQLVTTDRQLTRQRNIVEAIEAEVNQRCDHATANFHVRVLLGQLNFAPHDSLVFTGALEQVFCDFPRRIIEMVADPKTGYATQHSRADISLIREFEVA